MSTIEPRKNHDLLFRVWRRLIARENTTLLACDDDEAWDRAILALPPTATRERPPISHDMTEAAYCGDLLAYLDSVLEGKQGVAARVTA